MKVPIVQDEEIPGVATRMKQFRIEVLSDAPYHFPIGSESVYRSRTILGVHPRCAKNVMISAKPNSHIGYGELAPSLMTSSRADTPLIKVRRITRFLVE